MDLYAKGLGFPLKLNQGHGIDVVDAERSVRAMLEQILYTDPGERVNRPSFGVGIVRRVFEPNSQICADQLRIALEENVYNCLGATVNVLNLNVEPNEEELHIHVTFEIVGTVKGPHDLELVVPMEPGR